MSIVSVYWAPGHHRPTDLDYIRRLQPAVIRILDPDVSDVHQAHQAAPNAIIMLRYWWLDDGNGVQKTAMENTPAPTGIRHADEWSREVKRLEAEAAARGLAFPSRDRIMVTGVNEPDTRRLGPQIVAYTMVFLEQCRLHGLRAGAYCFSVGHPAHAGESPWDWAYFAKAQSAIKDGNHAVVLHEYAQQEGPFHNDDWGHLCGRHTTCPIDAPIIIGEWGIDGRIYERHPRHAGWRMFYEGQPATFADMLVQYHNRCDKRVIGICPFLTDYRNNEWQSFDTEPAHSAILARLPALQSHPVYIPSLPAGPSPGTPGEIPVPPQPAGNVPPLVHPIADPAKRRVTQRFGENPQVYAKFGLKGHNGLDFGVVTGTPIRAVADGIAINEDFDPDGYGLYAKVLHSWGQSLYAHLDKRVTGPGQTIKAGSVIGLSGNTGHSTAPHLHFAMRVTPFNRNDGWLGYSDPLPYLERGNEQPAQPIGSDVDLLARIITAEARGEPLEGQLAIAWVALNRASRPGWWGTTLREVLQKPEQFAPPMPHTETAFAIAQLAVAGLTVDPTQGSDHFHSGPPPSWAAGMEFVKRIGGHFFYRSRS